MKKAYEDYLWKIDNQHPQVRFSESNGGLSNGELNEKKIINVHNRDIKKAFEKAQSLKTEEFNLRVKRLIKDTKLHWEKVANPKKNILRALRELQTKIWDVKP